MGLAEVPILALALMQTCGGEASMRAALRADDALREQDFTTAYLWSRVADFIRHDETAHATGPSSRGAQRTELTPERARSGSPPPRADNVFVLTRDDAGSFRRATASPVRALEPTATRAIDEAPDPPAPLAADQDHDPRHVPSGAGVRAGLAHGDPGSTANLARSPARQPVLRFRIGWHARLPHLGAK